MAGFRPTWLAAVDGGWFDDDSERFLMIDDQSKRGNHADETPPDAITQSQFRLRLAELDADLFRRQEFRAFLYAYCNQYSNTEVWLERYIEHEWPVRRRGPFPFDYRGWVNQRRMVASKWNLCTSGVGSCGTRVLCVIHNGKPNTFYVLFFEISNYMVENPISIPHGLIDLGVTWYIVHQS